MRCWSFNPLFHVFAVEQHSQAPRQPQSLGGCFCSEALSIIPPFTWYQGFWICILLIESPNQWIIKGSCQFTAHHPCFELRNEWNIEEFYLLRSRLDLNWQWGKGSGEGSGRMAADSRNLLGLCGLLLGNSPSPPQQTCDHKMNDLIYKSAIWYADRTAVLFNNTMLHRQQVQQKKVHGLSTS